ncbi:hypothetical protein Hanom_Chr01g00018571 [Helianthus anomalus]
MSGWGLCRARSKSRSRPRSADLIHSDFKRYRYIFYSKPQNSLSYANYFHFHFQKMTTGDGDRSTGVFAFSLFFRLLILNSH